MRWVFPLIAACGRVDFDEVGSTSTADSGIDSAGVMPPGCALWLRMDEAAWTTAPGAVHDSCGSNDGTLDVATTTIVDSVRGRVGNFTGNECIVIPDNSTVDPSAALTVSAWYRPTDVASGPLGIIAKRDDIDVQHAYGLFTDIPPNGEVGFDVNDDQHRLYASTGVSDGVWQQATAVFDGTLALTADRLRIYINGTLDNSRTADFAMIAPATSAVRVGCQPYGASSEYFVGQLDDVIVWSRALSAAEVADWYGATRR